MITMSDGPMTTDSSPMLHQEVSFTHSAKRPVRERMSEFVLAFSYIREDFVIRSLSVRCFFESGIK